uniref:Reverse transcriptase domain-containing protein n=1 Tax=Tanacetum cinerariifolium TaxID=118510 RepID=A0A699I3E4_TANCI|nr:reverse transcriptase domain-containing protein [Tanacetum cinerariifolium]
MSSASAAVTYTSVYTHSEPEPIYPEYIPLEDEHILPAEEQPLPPLVSPTTESPGYVAESCPEEDPEEYEDDETENGPVDYPMDEGDEDDGDSSGDNADDEDEDEDEEDDEEEKEEHLAPADTIVVIPTDELVFPPKGTKSAEVERLLAMPTPLPSPLTSLSPPSIGESLTRCTAPAALPLPSLPLPLYMPPPIVRRDDIPEIEMPPRKKLCLSTLGFRYEVRESSTARPTRGQGIDYGFISTLDAEARRRGIGEVEYGIRDTWIDPAETVPEIAPMTMREVNTRVTKLAELHEHDTYDLYALLEDAQDCRTRISQRVDVDSIKSGSPFRASESPGAGVRTRVLALDTPDTAIAVEYSHSYTTPVVQMAETLRVMGDMRREMGDMQAELKIMAPVTRQGPSTLPNNTNLNNMTSESVQAMIDQALLRNSTNGDVSHSSHEDNRRNVQTARPSYYADFMKCQPLKFKGTEGRDAYSMTWEVLKKKMTDKYFPQGKIKKLEIELWNLKVKENNVLAYTERFQELTLISTKFVADETEKIDKYVNRLTDNIYESVKALKPKTLDETIELANDLMDQKLHTYAEKQSNNKRKADESFRNNHGQKQ